ISERYQYSGVVVCKEGSQILTEGFMEGRWCRDNDSVTKLDAGIIGGYWSERNGRTRGAMVVRHVEGDPGVRRG
ncbi:MAG: hypothetical protein ISS61_13205, partial [Desulfobacteraceae bacterium]|nr:hypothetical protein [Desulfobacteraceae bacterium]